MVVVAGLQDKFHSIFYRRTVTVLIVLVAWFLVVLRSSGEFGWTLQQIVWSHDTFQWSILGTRPAWSACGKTFCISGLERRKATMKLHIGSQVKVYQEVNHGMRYCDWFIAWLTVAYSRKKRPLVISSYWPPFRQLVFVKALCGLIQWETLEHFLRFFNGFRRASLWSGEQQEREKEERDKEKVWGMIKFPTDIFDVWLNLSQSVLHFCPIVQKRTQWLILLSLSMRMSNMTDE